MAVTVGGVIVGVSGVNCCSVVCGCSSGGATATSLLTIPPPLAVKSGGSTYCLKSTTEPPMTTRMTWSSMEKVRKREAASFSWITLESGFFGGASSMKEQIRCQNRVSMTPAHCPRFNASCSERSFPDGKVGKRGRGKFLPARFDVGGGGMDIETVSKPEAFTRGDGVSGMERERRAHPSIVAHMKGHRMIQVCRVIQQGNPFDAVVSSR